MGNSIGLLLTIISLILWFISFKTCALTISITSYLILLYAVSIHHLVKKRVNSELWKTLTRGERDAFLDFPIFIRFSNGSEAISATINFMRIVLIILGIVTVFKSQYILASFSFLYFFISSPTIARTAPNLYLVNSAKDGNHKAEVMLSNLMSALQKKELYDTNKNKEEFNG